MSIYKYVRVYSILLLQIQTFPTKADMFFYKDAAEFLSPLKRHINPNIFLFFMKLGPNTRSLAKNQKNRTCLR